MKMNVPMFTALAIVVLQCGATVLSGCSQVASPCDGVPRPANAALRTAGGPLVQAHRGGRHEYDDNAAGGFRQSLAAGIRGFETDVRFTKDRELVVMHDEHANRTTTGTGLIEGLTLAELKRMKLRKCGETVPSAADVFAAFKGYDDFFIEIEMKAYPGKFYTPEVLEDYCRKLNALAKATLPAGTYAFTCFNTGTLATMRKIDPDAPLGLIMWNLEESHLKAAKELRCCSVAPGLSAVDRATVDRCHAAGLLVCLWMVQDLPAYAEAWAKGADRITSDYPVALAKAIAAADDDALHSPFRLSALPDRVDGRYAAGETATVMFTACDSAGRKVGKGKAKVEIGDFTGGAVRTVTADLAKANPFPVEVSRTTPGFVRLAGHGCTCGIGFSADKLSVAPAVRKFGAIERGRGSCRVDEAFSDADWAVERVAAMAPDGTKVQGWVSKPRKARGRLPGRVEFFDRGDVAPVRTPGRITLSIVGADDSRSFVDAFLARPDVDASKVDCFATGRGALPALAVMAHEPRLKRGGFFVPDFGCEASVAAGFAARVTQPVRWCVGYADTVAPPDAAHAVYNALASKDRVLLAGLGMGHAVFEDYRDYVDAWSRGAEQAKAQYRFLAFNIWGPYFGNPVSERTPGIVEIVKRWNPDVAGFQEVHSDFWKSELPAALEGEYGIVGRGIGYRGADVHTPLLYRKSRFDLVDSGVVLYCPDLDDSKGAVWAVLRDRATGRKIVGFASHAWWRTDGEGDSWIRLHGSQLLTAKMDELVKKHDAAVIGGGDLNAPLSSNSLKWLLSHGYADAQASAEISVRRFPTEHGDPVRYRKGAYVGRDGARGHCLVRERSRYLDHIFYDPKRLNVRRFDLDISPLALRVSDHSPVVADFDVR